MTNDRAPVLQITPTSKDEMIFHDGKMLGFKQPSRLRWLMAKFGWHLSLACIILVQAFAILFYTKWYTRAGNVKEKIGTWFDVNPKVKNSGHPEVVNLTYMIVTCAFLTMMGGIFYSLSTKYVGMPTGLGRKITTFLRRKTFTRIVSHGEVLFLLLAILGNFLVFYFYYTNRIENKKAASKKPLPTVEYLNAVALGFGVSSIYTMMFLSLPASRHCYWMDMLNIPYAHGVKYHRWLGVLSIVLVALHGIVYGIAFHEENNLKLFLPCFNCDIGNGGMENWIIVFGELSFICMAIMGITSIPWIRRKYYEVFYYTHHLFILVVLFAVLHYSNMIAFFYPSIIIYMINRIISSSHSNVPTQVVDFAALPNGVTRIVLKRSMLEGGQCRAGDFVYLRLPAISHLQWHAFSISSSPSASPDTFTLYAKGLGDWTSKLHAHAVECKQTNTLPVIYVDGFYGTRVNLYEPYSTVVLVGGGIGITPLMGMIEELHHNMSQGHDVVEKQVYIVWACRDLQLLKEFEPAFNMLREYDPSGHVFKLNLYLTEEYDESMLTYKPDSPPLNTTAHEYNRNTILSISPRPFCRSTRSPFWQCLMFGVTFGVSAFFLVICRWNNNIRGYHKQWWPLQRLVELVVVVFGACLGYVVAGIEFSQRNNVDEKISVEHSLVAVAKNATESGNFTSEFNVASHRPDIQSLMQKIQDDAPSAEPIGVFVSGPHSLMHAVEWAGIKIQKSRFDIRHEEFEL